jgi:hypothetical protein
MIEVDFGSRASSQAGIRSYWDSQPRGRANSREPVVGQILVARGTGRLRAVASGRKAVVLHVVSSRNMRQQRTHAQRAVR